MMPLRLTQLLAAIAKETRIILRDIEALAILFVMPAVFVLIMSLAMQDVFQQRAGATFSILIVDRDAGDIGEALNTTLTENGAFEVTRLTPTDATQPLPSSTEVETDIHEGRYHFALLIPEQTSTQAITLAKQQLGIKSSKNPPAKITIQLLADPTLRRDHRLILVHALNQTLRASETVILQQQFTQFARTIGRRSGTRVPQPKDALALFASIEDPYQEDNSASRAMPTSVQQNAPAWALLAMFFLVIPMAGTVVRERQEGSLLRLQTMAAPLWLLPVGKILPYFIINQIQIGLILLEGIYLLPLLGGESLDIGNAPEAIAFLTMSISLAAIGYGLMVAAFCRTTEQATIFGATSVLVLAALGGIMVPKLVMPAFMQQLSVLSPLSWGLDGFMDIFVRGAGIKDIAHESLMLLSFAAGCLLIAIIRFAYKLKHN